MKRGEVYEYAVGSRLARVVIVSAETYNPRLATFAIIRHPSDAPAPSSTTVEVSHPVAGSVDLTRLRALDPSALRARHGRLTATAIGLVDRALRTYLDL